MCQAVYLYCFGRPLGSEKHQAKHYLGFAENLDFRDALHRAGRGAAITRAAVAQGIELHLARIWQGADRRFERWLKNRKDAPSLCPRCSGTAALARAQYRPGIGQLMLPLGEPELFDDFPAMPVTRIDWYEIKVRREWSEARAGLIVPSGHLDDDLL